MKSEIRVDVEVAVWRTGCEGGNLAVDVVAEAIWRARLPSSGRVPIHRVDSSEIKMTKNP